MASEAEIREWIDLLVHQTELDNLSWRQVAERDTFYLTLNDSSVFIGSRDNDELLPYELEISNFDGEILQAWLVFGPDQSQDGLLPGIAPEWLASRARTLYEIVAKQFKEDPIEGMLKELREMPPF